MVFKENELCSEDYLKKTYGKFFEKEETKEIFDRNRYWARKDLGFTEDYFLSVQKTIDKDLLLKYYDNFSMVVLYFMFNPRNINPEFL